MPNFYPPVYTIVMADTARVWKAFSTRKARRRVGYDAKIDEAAAFSIALRYATCAAPRHYCLDKERAYELMHAFNREITPGRVWFVVELSSLDR